MNVIITGGSGLIGKRLVKLLVSNGHHVTVLSRNTVKASERIKDADLVGWDGSTSRGWGHLVENCDAIVNLAGENIGGEGYLPTRWNKPRKQLLRDSRVQAGEAVVQAVRGAATRPSVVVQASGIGYYGNTGDTLADENSPAGDDFMARLAVDWENSTRAVENMGVRRVIIRSGVNLHARKGALPRMMLPFRLYAGGPVGGGQQYFPWIHPDDEAAAILFLIENRSANGAYNLDAPELATNAQFGKVLAKMLVRPYWFPLPAFAMRLAFGEVADMVLTGQRAQPKRLLEMGFRFKYPDLDTALASVLACPLVIRAGQPGGADQPGAEQPAV